MTLYIRLSFVDNIFTYWLAHPWMRMNASYEFRGSSWLREKICETFLREKLGGLPSLRMVCPMLNSLNLRVEMPLIIRHWNVQSSLIYYNFILDKSKVSTNISAKHKVSDNAFYFSDAFVTLKWIWASIATPPYSLPSISWPDDESFKKVVNVLNADAEVLKRQKERIKRISEPRNWPYDE